MADVPKLWHSLILGPLGVSEISVDHHLVKNLIHSLSVVLLQMLRQQLSFKAPYSIGEPSHREGVGANYNVLVGSWLITVAAKISLKSDG